MQACYIVCADLAPLPLPRLSLPAPAVVASALGIPALLPFLKAVCQSKKSWQARHTGIKIVQQIAILMGCAVLPHLRSLVDIVKHGGWGGRLLGRCTKHGCAGSAASRAGGKRAGHAAQTRLRRLRRPAGLVGNELAAAALLILYRLAC